MLVTTQKNCKSELERDTTHTGNDIWTNFHWTVIFDNLKMQKYKTKKKTSESI